jgi:hypothetical protein
MEPMYVTYCFLHAFSEEDDVDPLFRRMGLRSNDGSVIHPADEAWRSKVQLLEEAKQNSE